MQRENREVAKIHSSEPDRTTLKKAEESGVHEDADSGPPSGEIQSSFEDQLFRDGTLDFDFDQYVGETRRRLETRRDHQYPYEHEASWDPRLMEQIMTWEVDDAQHELVWRRRFSGQIPKHWDLWSLVELDFHRANKQGVTLSETLIDAGISHRNHLVANTVGQGQRLNKRQLAWLFVRPDFPKWNREEIIAAQKEMGASEEDLQDAIKMADRIREELRKRRVGAYTLGDGSSEGDSGWPETKMLPDRGNE